MNPSHVACLLALSEAANGLKMGDFMFFDVIMFFRKDRLRGKEGVARIR